MSAATVARPVPRLRALQVAADLPAIALVLAGVVVLTVVTWGTWGDLGRDTGYDFVAATRVAHGQFPYADYVYYYGPLAPLALGLAVLLGGGGLTTFVAVGLVLAYAIVGLTYALARTQTGPVGSALAAIATAAVAFSPTNLSFVVPHTYSESFAILLSLVFLLGLATAAAGRSAGALVAGFAAGLVALTRPEFEVAVVAAGLVWLAQRARAGRSVRREAAALVLPAVFVPAAVYGAFLTSVSLHGLLLENLYPADTLRAGGSAIVRAQAPLTLHSVVVVVGYLALYCLGCAALLLAARALERRSLRTTLWVVGAAAALVLAVAAADPEAVRSRLQWVFGGAPAGAVLVAVAFATLAIRRRRVLAPREQTLLALLVLTAVLAAKTYSGFFFLAERAQPAVYVAPFVFVALSRLHLVDLARSRAALAAGGAWLAVLALVCAGLTVKDARAQSATVSGPGGSIRVTPAEAPVYRAAIGAIDGGTEPGEPILLAPQLTALYTLTGRTDPLRQISLVPGALAKPVEQRQAILALRRARVRLVIVDRHSFGEYGQTRFGVSFDQMLSGWIRRHFNHAALLRPGAGVDHLLDVWMRRGS